MPCVQLKPEPGDTIYDETSQRGFATHEACAETCNDKEGACCVGAQCSITPPCECDKPGQTYLGDGTTCSPNLCEEQFPCKKNHTGACCDPSDLFWPYPLSGGPLPPMVERCVDDVAHDACSGRYLGDCSRCIQDANANNQKWCNPLP